MKKYYLIYLATILYVLFLNSKSTQAQDNALHFDGVNDYIRMFGYSNPVVLGLGRTTTAWIRTTDNNGVIMSWGTNIPGQRWTMQVLNGKLTLDAHNARVEGTSNIADGQWHHVAVVKDGTVSNVSGLLLYVDGRPESFSNVVNGATSVSTSSGQDLSVGAILVFGTPSNLLQGEIDEISIHDNFKSQAQIQELMHKRFDSKPPFDNEPSSEPNLINYYSCNQGNAEGSNAGLTTLEDAGSNAENGTLIGFSLNGTTSNWVKGVIYYTRQDGDWEDNNTWSVESVSGISCNCQPNEENNGDIRTAIAHQVERIDNDMDFYEVDIESSGTLDLKATSGHKIAFLNGTGTVRLQPVGTTYAFPAVTTNSFIVNAGSTVEYYGSTSGNLPSSIITYQNLVIEGGGTKTVTSDLTVMGNLTLRNSSTLDLQNRNLTLEKSIITEGIANSRIIQDEDTTFPIDWRVTFNITENVTISAIDEYTFNQLEINYSGGGNHTLEIEENIITYNDIIITNATLLPFTVDLNDNAFLNDTGLGSFSGTVTVPNSVTLRTEDFHVLEYKIYSFDPEATLFLDGSTQEFTDQTLNIGNLRIGNNFGIKQLNQHITVNDLTFDGTASTLRGAGGGFVLDVQGNWTDNGNGGFDANDMNVEFVGTGNSEISQSSGDMIFENLNINKDVGSSATFQNDIQVNNTLRLIRGNLLINGYTLYVDNIDARAIGTASINYSTPDPGQIVFENYNNSNDIHLILEGGNVTINGAGGKITFASTDDDDIDLRLGTNTSNLGQLVFNNLGENMFFQTEDSAIPVIIESVSSTVDADKTINLASFGSTRLTNFTGDINIAGGANLGGEGGINTYSGIINIGRSAFFNGISNFSQDVSLNTDNKAVSCSFSENITFASGTTLSIGGTTPSEGAVSVDFFGFSTTLTFSNIIFNNNTSVSFAGDNTVINAENFTFDLEGETGFGGLNFGVSQTFNVSGTISIKGPTSGNFNISSFSGNAVTLDAASPQSWENVDVRDIDASAGATITVTGGTDLGNNTNVFFTPRDYYWIGGNGNWEDPTQWSNTSGGIGDAGVPGGGDNVFFDVNSFAPGQTITITDGVEVGSLDFTGVAANVKVNLADSQLNIKGDLTLDPNMSFISNPYVPGLNLPAVILEEDVQNITSNGAKIKFLALANTQTVLQDDLAVEDMLFVFGDMNLNGHDLKVEKDWLNFSGPAFATTYSGAGNVIFTGSGSSSIEVSEDFPSLIIDKDSDNLSVSISDATVTITATNTQLNSGSLDLGNFNLSHDLGTITGTSSGKLRIASNTSTLTFPTATFGDNNTTVEFYGNTDYTFPANLNLSNVVITGSSIKTLNGSSPGTIVQDLTIEPGATLSGSGTTTLQVKGDWDNQGTFLPGSDNNVIFNGNTIQTLDKTSGAESFNGLQVNKTLFNLRPNADLSITNNLTLSNGNVVIPITNISLAAGATITGGSTSSYIATTGTGELIFENLGTGTRLFPIGTATSYAPAEVNLALATSGNSSARVRPPGQNGLFNLPSPDSFVDLVWDINIPNNGSSANQITLNWQSVDVIGTLSTQTTVHKYTSDWVAQSSSYTPGDNDILATSIDTYEQFAVYVPDTQVILSTVGPSVAGDITAGTTENIVYQMSIEVNNSNTDLTSVTLATSGSFTNTDISNFKLILSEDDDFTTTADNTQLGSTNTTGGIMLFDGFVETLSTTLSPYTLFLVADATSTAISGRNINIQTPNLSNFTFSSGNLSGTLSEGTTQTIIGTPTLTSIDPTSVSAGGSDFTLTATGTLFDATSTIQWNGSDLATTFVSDTELTAIVPASNIISPGTVAITVAEPVGGTSATIELTVENTTPTIVSISPTNANAGSSDFLMVIIGTNFASNSVARWDGTDMTTTFLSSTQVLVSVPASNLTAAGTFPITVFNPGATIPTSNAVDFTVNNPFPILTSITPNSIAAGGSDFILTANGNNFNENSIIRWNGTDLTTTFVSNTELSATVLAADIATAGVATVTVFNPTPGGGSSTAQTFTITEPILEITLINPTEATAGDPDFTLAVFGEGFIPSSVVRWEGIDLATTFVSATELSATVTAGEIATAGIFNIDVTNITLTSNQEIFVVNNPSPSLSSITPSAVAAGGSDFTLTVNGSSFNSSSLVSWDATDLVTSFVSSSQITANVPASLIVDIGTASITVSNPSPGGGTTSGQTITIESPTPSITTLSPSNVPAGSSGFSMTIIGSDFNPNSIVRWEGSDLATSYISATQLSAIVPATNLTTAGTASVTVLNPPPGGGESSPATFTITTPAPEAPFANIASGVTPSSFVANWNTSDFADSYLLDVSEVSDFSTFIIQDEAVTTLSYSVTGLTEEQTYFYRVRAVNTLGTSAYSNIISVTTVSDGLNAPSNLSLTALSATEVDVFWTDNSDTEISYQVERSLTGLPTDFSPVASLSPNAVFYADNSLSPNTTYYYRVKAIGESSESPYSTIESLTTPPIIPLRPTDLDAVTVSTSQIDLFWNDNANDEDNYYIERSEGNFDNFVQIAIVGADTDSYSDTGLENNITYFYRVRAEKNLAFSGYSNIAGATTSNVPLAPTNLLVTATGITNVTLIWEDNAINETGYTVEVFTLINNFFIEVAIVDANSTTAVINDLDPNRTHIFRVKAFNENGDSPYSNEATTVTAVDPNVQVPDAPSFLEATSVTQNEIGLRWQDNSSNEITFKIERSLTGLPTDFVEVAEVLGGTTRYNDLGLSANVEYFYRVRASNEGGNSPYSNIANARADCNLLVLVESETGGNIVCDGKEALLTANTNTSNANYRWLKNGLPITGATLSTYLASEEGAYTCEIISGGCRQTADPEFVLIFQEGFDINISLLDNLLEADFAGAEFYQWYYEFLPISGANSDTYTPTQAGIYYVVATDNDCSATSNAIDFGDITTSLEDLSLTNIMEIAPNPSSGLFKLSIESDKIMGEYEIFLITMTGKSYRISRGLKTRKALFESLDITRFAQGNYILEFRHKGKRGRKRLMKY